MAGSFDNPTGFAMSGAFDNPAGFAAALALLFPAGLYLVLTEKYNNYLRFLTGTALVTMETAIVLSGSRTAMLSILVSSGLLVLFQTPLLGWAKARLPHWKIAISVFFIILLVGVVASLYRLNKQSANGRLLIWRVSANMIADNPMIGCGRGCFKAQYMDYQAAYFAQDLNSRFRQLADNDKAPFNEFILVTVEYGFIGLGFLLLFLFYLCRSILLSGHRWRFLCFSTLAGLLVFACFSYPLQYVAVWLLAIFYGTACIATVRFQLPNHSWKLAGKIVVVLLAMVGLFFTVLHLRAQVQWNKVALQALAGEAQATLPKYRNLYPRLKNNPLFLYNYGAELNAAGKYQRSTAVLQACMLQFDDYDVQMLLADNAKNQGKTKEAIKIYKHASNMIPNRFLPLYRLVQLYRRVHDTASARRLARRIVKKSIKVPSHTVYSIQVKMQHFMDSLQETEK